MLFKNKLINLLTTTRSLNKYRYIDIFKDVKLEDYKEVYGDDLVKKKHIVEFLRVYEEEKFNNLGRVPKNISPKTMADYLEQKMIFDHNTKESQYIKYLYLKESNNFAHKKRLDNVKTRIFHKHNYMENLPELSPNQLKYTLWQNTLFTRIPLQASILKYETNMCIAAKYGPKLIFDLSFSKMMNLASNQNCAEQIASAISVNRRDREGGFDLYFSNWDQESILCKKIMTFNASSVKNHYATKKEGCFTEHFDKNRLVYLSPDAKVELNEPIGSSDDIYIIGAIVDLNIAREPHTLRKAQMLGIRTRRLPLTTHLEWRSGTKSLCLNQVVQILLDSYKGIPWSETLLANVPIRKLKTHNDIQKMNINRRKAEKNLMRFNKYRVI